MSSINNTGDVVGFRSANSTVDYSNLTEAEKQAYADILNTIQGYNRLSLGISSNA